MNELYSISRGYGNVLSHEVDEAVALMGGGVLWNVSTGGIGTGWLPVASMVPEFAGRSHVLPGNDVISGGPGSDFVIGDRSILESHVIGGIEPLEALLESLSTEIDLATHTMRYLALDAAALPGAEPAVRDVAFGNDVLYGSADLLADQEAKVMGSEGPKLDTVVGDHQHTITALYQGLPVEDGQELLLGSLTAQNCTTRACRD